MTQGSRRPDAEISHPDQATKRAGTTPMAAEDRLSAIPVPDKVGQYTVIRALGSGGMGTVYLAQQTAPLDRQVAIKVVRPGLHNTQELITRFESERRALGLMAHPNIAQVFEAGTTDEGRPYFVMEFVDGESLTRHCNHHRLTIRQRLELFLHVVEGVRHAHQKGIIHRDLKPGNILVATIDGTSVPKIIDFGLAKALEAPDDGSEAQTLFGQVVGTPAFMSPEQASGRPYDLDVRTDVYSLGVVLYTLLVDRMPTAQASERTPSAPDGDPPTPRTRLARLGSEAEEVAKGRNTDLKSLLRALRGDLNWIALRAMDADRERRYPSAEALAEDIRRHLSNRMISARPQTMAYRLRKLAARRTGLVTAVSLLLIGILAGIAGITVGLVKARQGERAARHEAAKVTAVNEFLNHMLVSSNPRALGRDVHVADVLDQVSDGISSAFPDTPEIEASIRTTIGESYLALGEYDKAADHLRRVREISWSEGAPLDESSARVEGLWADMLFYIDRLPESEEAYRRVWAYSIGRFGASSAEAVRTQLFVADTLMYQDKNQEAAELFRDAVQRAETSCGPDDPETANALVHFATFLAARGDGEQARELNERALAIFEHSVGSDHPDTLDTLNNLAISCYRSRDYEAAEHYFRRTLETSRSVMGEDHPDTLITMKSLGVLLLKVDRAQMAEPFLRGAFEAFNESLGPEHPRTLSAMGALAVSLATQGQAEESERLARRAYDAQMKHFGKEHTRTKNASIDLARVLFANGSYRQARAVLRPIAAAVADDPEAHGPGIHTAETLLARCLEAEGAHAAAVEHLLIAIKRLEARFGPEAEETEDAQKVLAELRSEDRGSSSLN